jgi:excisionase family DNA binding protein
MVLPMPNEKTETDKLAYSVADVMQRVALGRSLIYQEIKDGRLKIFKVGSRTLISAADLKSWLNYYQEAAARSGSAPAAPGGTL